MYDKIKLNWHKWVHEFERHENRPLEEIIEVDDEETIIEEEEAAMERPSLLKGYTDPNEVAMISWDELKVTSPVTKTPVETIEEIIKDSREMISDSNSNTPKKKRHRKHKKKKENQSPQDEVKTESKTKELKAELKINQDNSPKKLNSSKKKKGKVVNGLPAELWIKTIEELLSYPFGKDCVQKTGKVVHIVQKNHPRIAGGRLNPPDPNSDGTWIKFSPQDSKVPRIMLPLNEIPQEFFYCPQHFEKTLFMVKITDWPGNSSLPFGRIVQSLGEAGQIESESQLILSEHEVDDSPFPQEVEKELKAKYSFWNIPQEEWSYRENFTEECIFTIDPATARDLDDALSIKLLDTLSSDGKRLYEVGVHIADVSFFLQEDTPLDEVAKTRTTSYYLVQRAIPMLPRLLCEKLCSLNPGEDKLTFSVIWTMNEDAEVKSTRFTRSVIRSCIKLSYQQAQDMIEDPSREWTHKELPVIFGKSTYKDVSRCTNQLWFLADKLRHKRIEGGSLQIDKIKFLFVLDPRSGLPIGFSTTSRSNSNSLVEEFMLLANMAVGRKIFESDKYRAVLRTHPSPDMKQLRQLKEFCATRDTEIDTTTSRALQESLNLLRSQDPVMSQVISHMLLLSMKNAVYVNSSVLEEASDTHHYALNVDCYTHFTSPIRRYPDVLVHRVLASVLGYAPKPEIHGGVLEEILHTCNKCKQASRYVSDKSQRLFLSLYIKEVGMTEEGVVIKILDKSFDALVFRLGILVRVYMDKYPVTSFKPLMSNGIPSLDIHCENQAHVTVSVSSLVSLQLFVQQDDLKIEASFLND